MSTAWDAQRYQDKHSFVWRYGATLLDLLDPRPGQRILDLGCGTGQLTAQIAQSGADVTGLDASPVMLEEARKNYPNLKFVFADAAGFRLPGAFDAVFSNAALHWVKDASGAAQSISQALLPGGRFVAELGGQGNIASIQAALRAVWGPSADERSPWYYPSIGEYASVLERHGLEVRQASLFDRPTQLEGPNGIEDWLRTFCQVYLGSLPPDRAAEAVRDIAARLRPTQFRDGVWTVDYRRLRIVAVKIAN
ncbi:MAG TPA: methyltransferase domain-containing protein [Bryobacteraceae bacterium]|nr:methyltransferase domain-containing protein [Bryobacteraceae bacterium]